ncbi:MAG: adenine phosphoribosyltransferase [Acidimicrobiales bacterium]
MAAAALDPDLEARLRSVVRTVPDWPHAGIMFRDVTPLFSTADTFRLLTAELCAEADRRNAVSVAGVDARGFIVGAAMAHELGIGFVPIRKAGKLPADVIAESYDLEYGSATVEIHVDSIGLGDRVVLVDDLIATGGTMLAAHRLLTRLGAVIVSAMAIVDLPELGGSAALEAAGLDVYSLLTYEGD